MNEDYLWDKSGPPDPEVVHLEQLLVPFRHQQKPPVRRIPKALGWLAAAAVLTAAVAIPLSRRGQITDWNYSAAGMEARAVRTGEVYTAVTPVRSCVLRERDLPVRRIGRSGRAHGRPERQDRNANNSAANPP